MRAYKMTDHCKYLCQYHLIWCPKFRFRVLSGKVEEELGEMFRAIADKYGYEIIENEIMEDHIHLLVGAKPTVSPIDIVRTMKSITAVELFKRYPNLKKFYGKCGCLWSRGKFVSTAGNVSGDTIKKYIEEQKSK